MSINHEDAGPASAPEGLAAPPAPPARRPATRLLCSRAAFGAVLAHYPLPAAMQPKQTNAANRITDG